MLFYFVEHNRYLNIVGILVIALIAYIFSHNRRAINLRLILSALALHFVFAFAMLRTAWGQIIVGNIAEAAGMLYVFAEKGIEFMFGKLGDQFSFPASFNFNSVGINFVHS